MAKKIDELERPKIPGYIDMSKVNSAAGNIAAARDAINNLNYDTFKQGTQYGNLKKSYEQQGQAAMKDTLGQVAARTGGMASSYATSAANQSYNNYMQTLEDAARSMFNEEYARKKDAYNMAQQEYDDEWNRYQNEYSQAWDKYNAENSNFQSDRTYNYQLKRDQKSDKDAETTQAQDDILAIWKAGGTPSVELLQAAGWYDEATGGVNAIGTAYKSEIDEGIAAGDKTEGQKVVDDLWATGTEPTDEQYAAAGYKTKNSDGSYSWTTEGLAAYNSKHALTDSEIEAMFLADGFDWNTWLNGDKAKNLKGLDMDRDGNYGEQEDLEMFFANSNRGGAEIWNQWLTDEQSRISDENTADAQGRVSDAWAAGDDPVEKDLIAAGYIEVDDEGKAIMENGDYKYTTAGKDALANSSALGKMDMEYLLTSGNWTWGDWDRDGTVEDDEDVTAKQFFSKSGGSKESWEKWLNDYNQAENDKTTKESQTKNTNRIDAMLKNGASLEDIEKEFGIGPDGETWESVTGMSRDEWQTKQTGYRQGSYKFQDTSAGRSEIVDKLIDSGLSLNATDADNFDYIWGDGAYNAIQTMADSIKRLRPGERDANDTFDYQYENIKKLFPGISDDTILSILEAANPKAFDAWK
jgi:hypothetical protein